MSFPRKPRCLSFTRWNLPVEGSHKVLRQIVLVLLHSLFQKGGHPPWQLCVLSGYSCICLQFFHLAASVYVVGLSSVKDHVGMLATYGFVNFSGMKDLLRGAVHEDLERETSRARFRLVRSSPF